MLVYVHCSSVVFSKCENNEGDQHDIMMTDKSNFSGAGDDLDQKSTIDLCQVEGVGMYSYRYIVIDISLTILHCIL